MKILKSKLFEPRKCEYGEFELIPDDGWEISRTFIDYESKLLIVSVSITDESKWVDTGFGGRIIPKKEYKIDLQTLRILETEEWKRYFNYDKIETISEDGKYKLVSQRIFKEERNSDSYQEELYDLATNERISYGSSIAFRNKKRENMLEERYRDIKEQEEQTQILDSKPDLNQFFINQLLNLKEGDRIICYNDNKNTYLLSFADKKFVLKRSFDIPTSNKKWTDLTYYGYQIYDDLDSFWSDFSATENWYTTFHPNNNQLQPTKILVLAKHLINYFNEVRRKHSFTFSEYQIINEWNNLAWSEDYKKTELKQWCPNCYKEVFYMPRYPKYICGECASKNKFDRNGNLIEFSNIGFSGGFKIIYKNGQGEIIKEDDSQYSCDCIIEGKKYFAQEARFGGIVIQTKD